MSAADERRRVRNRGYMKEARRRASEERRPDRRAVAEALLDYVLRTTRPDMVLWVRTSLCRRGFDGRAVDEVLAALVAGAVHVPD